MLYKKTQSSYAHTSVLYIKQRYTISIISQSICIGHAGTWPESVVIYSALVPKVNMNFHPFSSSPGTWSKP